MTTRPACFGDIKRELLNRPPVWRTEDVHPLKSGLLALAIPGLQPPRKVRLRTHPFPQFVLPQGHHLLYCVPDHPSDVLLPDGTDPDHSPGPPFTRRLWAAGSVTFDRHWRVHVENSRLVCRESIADVWLTQSGLTGVPPTDQPGLDMVPGAGDKVFVVIKRKYVAQDQRGDDIGVIVDRRTLCFITPKTPAEVTEDRKQPSKMKMVQVPKTFTLQYSHSFTLSSAALFRFSALTFNAHKIHLDRHHCREVEGYRDLLVHGPLLLVLMFSVLAENGTPVRSLTYRNLAPVFVGEKVEVCCGPSIRKSHWNVWIVGPCGDLRVRGTAILEDQAEDVLRQGPNVLFGPETSPDATDVPSTLSPKTEADHDSDRLFLHTPWETTRTPSSTGKQVTSPHSNDSNRELGTMGEYIQEDYHRDPANRASASRLPGDSRATTDDSLSVMVSGIRTASWQSRPTTDDADATVKLPSHDSDRGESASMGRSANQAAEPVPRSPPPKTQPKSHLFRKMEPEPQLFRKVEPEPKLFRKVEPEPKLFRKIEPWGKPGPPDQREPASWEVPPVPVKPLVAETQQHPAQPPPVKASPRSAPSEVGDPPPLRVRPMPVKQPVTEEQQQPAQPSPVKGLAKLGRYLRSWVSGK